MIQIKSLNNLNRIVQSTRGIGHCDTMTATIVPWSQGGFSEALVSDAPELGFGFDPDFDGFAVTVCPEYDGMFGKVLVGAANALTDGQKNTDNPFETDEWGESVTFNEFTGKKPKNNLSPAEIDYICRVLNNVGPSLALEDSMNEEIGGAVLFVRDKTVIAVAGLSEIGNDGIVLF